MSAVEVDEILAELDDGTTDQDSTANVYGRSRGAAMDTVCAHCGRRIINEDGRWIDPEATIGDDIIWRETCDANEAFTAEHEPLT